MKKIVCVLSGGSAKGAAHVGAVKALYEWDLRPAHYVGTSIGGVMGACFACGLPYEEVLRRISTLTRGDVAVLSPAALLGVFAKSLFRGRPWRETIEALVPASTFEELETPLTVTAVDGESGELVLFGAGGRLDVPLRVVRPSFVLPSGFDRRPCLCRRWATSGVSVGCRCTI